MARLDAPGRGLDELTQDPGSCRVGRHIDVDQLTSAMAMNTSASGRLPTACLQTHEYRHRRSPHLGKSWGRRERHVLRPERQGWYGQQVGGPEMVSMVAQDRPPTLAGWTLGPLLAVMPN